MKKLAAYLFLAMLITAEALNAGCTVRMPCSEDVNDWVQCDGKKCERIKGTYKSQNEVKCDGEVTKCSDNSLPAILEF